MADDEVGAEHADRVEPFNGRLAVAMDHLVEFDDGLAGMGLHRQAATPGLLQRFLEEALAAGVDLRRANHAGDPAAGMFCRFVERRHRGFEGLLAGLLVPGILNGMAVLRVPDALAHHRADDGADAGRGEVVRPAGARHRKIGDGRHAALQQLRDRDLGGGACIFGIEAEHRQIFVERALAELVAAILLGEALVGGLGEGMAVDVDEAGDGHHPLALDDRVDRARVARSDMGDLVALEHEIGIFEIDVSPLGLVPRNDVVEAGDLGRLHKRFAPIACCLLAICRRGPGPCRGRSHSCRGP